MVLLLVRAEVCGKTSGVQADDAGSFPKEAREQNFTKNNLGPRGGFGLGLHSLG